MAVRTNRALDPRVTATNDWLPYAGTGGVVTTTFPATGGPLGTAPRYGRMSWTTAPSDNGGNWGIGNGRVAITAGQVYTASVYMRSSVAKNYQMVVNVLNAGGGFINAYGSGLVAIAANTWTRISVTFTADALTTQMELDVRNQGANFAIGNTFDVGALLIEQAASAGSYFDGSFSAGGGVTYAWTGTADASASTATTVSPPAIQTIPQTSPTPRIGVQLTDWTNPANGSIQVWRVHPDTSEWPVRGSGAAGSWMTSGGSAFAWDYEMPLDVPVTYYALDGGVVIGPTTPVNLGITSAWLKAPGNPGSDLKILVDRKPEQIRPRPAVVLEPLGRENAVVIMDARKGARFKLSVRTKTDAEAAALLATLKTALTVLLLMPGVRDRWRYVAVTDHAESPVVDYRPPAGAPANHIAYWSDWELTCIATDRPIGGVVGDPTASYQAIFDTYATYTAVKVGEPTYLDVLKGV